MITSKVGELLGEYFKGASKTVNLPKTAGLHSLPVSVRENDAMSFDFSFM